MTRFTKDTRIVRTADGGAVVVDAKVHDCPATALCRIYFEIAADAWGEGEVLRRTDAAIAAMSETE